MITQKELNGFFAPLNARIRELVRPFCQSFDGFNYTTLTVSNNYTLLPNGKYYENSYPLPAILVYNYCLIVCNNNEIIVKAKMNSSKAINYDLSRLNNYNFEIYNPYNRNDIIWKKGMTKETFKRKMYNYEDNDIAFDFIFNYDVDANVLYNFVKVLKKNKLYYNNN